MFLYLTLLFLFFNILIRIGLEKYLPWTEWVDSPGYFSSPEEILSPTFLPSFIGIAFLSFMFHIIKLQSRKEFSEGDLKTRLRIYFSSNVGWMGLFLFFSFTFLMMFDQSILPQYLGKQIRVINGTVIENYGQPEIYEDPIQNSLLSPSYTVIMTGFRERRKYRVCSSLFNSIKNGQRIVQLVHGELLGVEYIQVKCSTN